MFYTDGSINIATFAQNRSSSSHWTNKNHNTQNTHNKKQPHTQQTKQNNTNTKQQQRNITTATQKRQKTNLTTNTDNTQHNKNVGPAADSLQKKGNNHDPECFLSTKLSTMRVCVCVSQCCAAMLHHMRGNLKVWVMMSLHPATIPVCFGLEAWTRL